MYYFKDLCDWFLHLKTLYFEEKLLDFFFYCSHKVSDLMQVKLDYEKFVDSYSFTANKIKALKSWPENERVTLTVFSQQLVGNGCKKHKPIQFTKNGNKLY